MTTKKKRIEDACKAMKEYGAEAAGLKKVINTLLKLYDNKWEYIEAENYRVLADVYFEQTVRASRSRPENKDENPASKRSLRPRKSTGSTQTQSQSRTPKGGSTSSALSLPPFHRKRGAVRSCPERSVQPDLSENVDETPAALSIEFDEQEEEEECAPLVRRRKNSTCVSSQRSEMPQSIPELSEHDRKFDDDDETLHHSPIAKIHPGDPIYSKEVGSSFVDLDDDEDNCSEVFRLTCGETLPPQGIMSGPKAPASSKMIDLESPASKDGCLNEVTDNVEATNPELVGENSEPNSQFLEIASTDNSEVKIVLIHPNADHQSLSSVIKSVERRVVEIYGISKPDFSLLNIMKDVCEFFLKDPSGSSDVELVKPNESVNVNDNMDVLATGQRKMLYCSDDITRRSEERSISIVNEINREQKPEFCYISKNVTYKSAEVDFSLAQFTDENCCTSCTDDCTSGAKPCACAGTTGYERAYTKDGLLNEKFLDDCISITRDPPNQNRWYCQDCPLRGKSLTKECQGHLMRKFIKECWFACACTFDCGNRIIQNGIKADLQVFMTPDGKGWGVRTLEELPKGSFICEFAGQIFTISEVLGRSSPNKICAGPLDADWSSKEVLKDESILALDATESGNVARFFNHRCTDPNMIQIPVEVDTTNRSYYHIAFFTTRKVNALEELTWDYGAFLVEPFNCLCGSENCKNINSRKRPRSS